MNSNQSSLKTLLRASLLDLPLELRIIIYEYYLRNAGPISLAKVRQRFIGEPTSMIALLSVSKVINAEATPIFYDKNIWLMVD